jgi:glycosyltransferase involved in cell wall biosynthesis
MRLLHIISSMNPATGGVCSAVQMIIKGLSDLGVLNEVVCMDDPGADFLLQNKFKIYAVGNGRSSWNYTRKLYTWLKKNIKNYDIIIVHGLWQYHSFAAHKAWKQTKANQPKLFIMPHGMLDPYFQKAPGRKWKAIRNWMFWKFIEGKIINNSTGLLFTCESEKVLAQDTFSPYKPKQEQVVGLGIEHPPVFEHKMKAAFEKIIGSPLQPFLLFIGRIDRKKGIDLLIKAYIKLRHAGNKLPQLVIAGPGIETEYGKHIVDLAKQDNHIIFTGMLSGDAKWGAFYGAGAFILTSHQENFGIAVVEALACEKPVLISDRINIWREILTDGAGFVENDSMEGAERLLLKWLGIDTETKNAITRNANECFLRNFTVEKASEKLYRALSAG